MELTGYHYDEVRKKYFKLTPKELADSKLKAKPKKNKLESVQTKVDPSRGNWNDIQLGNESVLNRKHKLNGIGLNSFESISIYYPELIESISEICFDSTNSIIRIAGEGKIVTGNLNPIKNDYDYYPNDQERWRIESCLPGTISSLNSFGGRMVATCLGPQAQAIISEVRSPLASITLSPKKTTIFTSAISSTTTALGCDSKILLTTDLSRSEMNSFVTGDPKGGGGAVFALELTRNLVFAGTRKGQVKIVDCRTGKESNSNLQVTSSVTNLKRISSGLLVAAMDGSMAIYDLRNQTRPVLSLLGHENSYTRGLGFDIWADEFLIAAGQDKKIRLWSLKTGELLSKNSGPTSLFSRNFSSPVKALKFYGGNNNGERDDFGNLEFQEEMGIGGVSLFVADESRLEKFKLRGN